MNSVTVVTANELIETINVSGSGALNATLTAAAAVDNGDGTVRLGISADIFDADSMLLIEGTVNYDGIRTVRSVSAGYINIEATFIAETTATADTVKVAIAPGHPFELLGLDIHLSAAPTTSENITLIKDAGLGANYDTLLLTKDFSVGSIVSYVWPVTGRLIFPNGGDKIRADWANTDVRDYGLILTYRRL